MCSVSYPPILGPGRWWANLHTSTLAGLLWLIWCLLLSRPPFRHVPPCPQWGPLFSSLILVTMNTSLNSLPSWKSHKGKTGANNYDCPISLLCIISKVLEKHIHSKILAFLDSTSTGAVDRCLPHFSIAADRCWWFSLKLGPSHVRGSSRVNTWPTLFHHLCQWHFWVDSELKVDVICR